ncbi:hypothetical protein [Desulfosporosinus hippei]|uniref:Uncharacterized protein n=1 Tax=Desulfosporosinus hippei DSM 8344 TaxID=1121419 RepID=A0A1G8KUK1_9FIRM|nr:hypothetical protein [Desulfosporosinus hippei]SDI47118.1 hypothetical protein SAMN05443529_14118 [Desulfosporosinus hippei DSM 8344]
MKVVIEQYLIILGAPSTMLHNLDYCDYRRPIVTAHVESKINLIFFEYKIGLG